MKTDQNGQGLFWESGVESESDQSIPGLRYVSGFLSEEQHATILHSLERTAECDWQEIHLRGVVARRSTLCFGWNYVTTSRSLSPAPPIPEWLLGLRDRSAMAAGVAAEVLEQVIVARYPAGAGIGRHIDAPAFGEPVVGVSIHGAARMKFERPHHEPVVIALEPRSLYVMSGEARWQWTHTVPAVKVLRYAITFRTLRNRADACTPITPKG